MITVFSLQPLGVLTLGKEISLCQDYLYIVDNNRALFKNISTGLLRNN